MTGGIFAILDDIATLLDDAALMSKVAARKTAGILGDDLAVNAEKATGFHASRELPVLWAITKGSFVNKLIILPLAFLLSAWAPWLIVPVLLIGGTYLCYEGVEKVVHFFSHAEHARPAAETTDDSKALLRQEAAKVKSAVRTDFILSIEIVVIALGTVIEERLLLQVMVVTLIALLATVGVYGIVALIVRMDDMGFGLIRLGERLGGALTRPLALAGAGLVASLPWVIRGLGVIGTIAMLLVGGGMFTHNLVWLHHLLGPLPTLAANLLVALGVGALALMVMKILALALRRVSA